jgi:hypothetical protein
MPHQVLIRLEGNRAVHAIHGCSLEVPDGWEVRDVFGVRDPDVIMNLAPRGAKWPNIEFMCVGRVRNPSLEETQRFARTMLAKRKWPIIEDRTFEVGGFPAYEVSYRHVLPFWLFWLHEGPYCKVSVFKDDIEYLLQLAAEEWESDKLLFDKCVQSVRL